MAGCPCILTDLTNTIRYGDICILVGPDPTLIEVKSSNTKNRRSRRQNRDLQQLKRFYITDYMESFRGYAGLQRIATQLDLVSFESEFNQCIRAAYEHGFAISSPEGGVCYIAITDSRVPISEIFDKVDVSAPWVFVLNSVKTDRAWQPYYPFTLLIEDEKPLYDFMLGRLNIVVLLDTEVMNNHVKDAGYIPEIVIESEYPIRARKHSEEEQMNISRHLILRAALEAVSLKWIIHMGLQAVEQPEEAGFPTRGKEARPSDTGSTANPPDRF